MKEKDKLYTFYKLKEVKRTSKVKDRPESTAEHTYSCIMLAQYFIKKYPKLNEKKIIQMILYHDMGEIYAGDTFILENKKREEKEREENKAMKKLQKEVPEELAEEMANSWKEYSENKTKEAKFVRAIDALDAIIHVIKQPEEWKKYGFTEKKLRQYKEPFFKEFPIILKFFNKMIEELKEEKIIPEEP